MLNMIKNALGLGPKAPSRPVRTTEPPEFDDVIGGCWGNKIEWFTCDFANEDFKVAGWKPLEDAPQVGWVIKAEMSQSWVWFEIIEIDWQRDPADMFFARLEPIAQQRKGEDRVYFVGEEI